MDGEIERVCAWERRRERQYVCERVGVCVRERERERGDERVGVTERQRRSLCVCV